MKYESFSDCISFHLKHMPQQGEDATIFNTQYFFLDFFVRIMSTLLVRECNFSIPSKVNVKCVYEGKCRSKCIIYEVKFSKCDAIYIGNTQQTFKKIMDGHFSDLQRLLKNGQKLD